MRESPNCKLQPKFTADETIVPKEASMLYNAALVLEGGAMRGQYTAGVLDFFMQQGIQFKTVIGVSAGALSGTNYISHQPGRTNAVNVHHRMDRNYISLRRALRRQDIINLDYLFESHGGDWEDFDESDLSHQPDGICGGGHVHGQRPRRVLPLPTRPRLSRQLKS
jgi:predicted acylesterase/phospholipase RssA